MMEESPVFGKGIRGSIEPSALIGSVGIRHQNPYKVSTDGQYGNLIIDLHKLYSQNKLVAKDKDTGKEVMNMKVDDDLIDLIDKRYYKNKTKHTQPFLERYLTN